MPYQLEPFSDVGLTPPLLESLIGQHESRAVPTLKALWTYYRNPIVALSSAAGCESGLGSRPYASTQRLYRLGQERGLPARLVGKSAVALDDRAAARREIVIENDIAWRIHTMVDFMFGRRLSILSTAADEQTRRTIERVLDAVWESSGGIALLQDAGLLGHVYGHVDLVVRRRDGTAEAGTDTDGAAIHAAAAVGIEVVEPTRGLALLSSEDYRTLAAYVIRYERHDPAPMDAEPGIALARHGGAASMLSRVLGWRGEATRGHDDGATQPVTVTEILTAAHRQVYEENRAAWGPGSRSSTPARDAGPRLVLDEPNRVSLASGVVPVVHIQNISQPFAYAGLSEVEPLIPLQDELNTRLCDRASRVTMQSFRMYLAKGVDGFDKNPVSPGQVWATDNIDAKVDSFGGDADAPGEDEHIEQIREAMDKASGVPPLASGVVRAKIGNLTSENALRVTLLGLLSKTARKRVTYGRGIAQVCRLVLDALDDAGILKTAPTDRGVRIEWPDPLPRDERELLDAAKTKIELGVPREQVLSELGYSPADPGIE
ncbi:MAG: phage portal protein [Phycisphaerales bacterium]